MEKMLTNAPHNVNTPEIISGAVPYTTHYYGIMGPMGTNSATGQPYAFDNKEMPTHGGFSLAGIFMRDTTGGTGTGPDIGFKVAHITDGTSNTLMVGEASWRNDITGTRYRSWARGCDFGTGVCPGTRNVTNGINTPSITLFNDIAFGSHHQSGTSFALADGSTRFVLEYIDINVYRSLASRDGSEPTVIY
jgi:hypothetical protein